jgi:hypothetical protein
VSVEQSIEAIKSIDQNYDGSVDRKELFLAFKNMINKNNQKMSCNNQMPLQQPYGGGYGGGGYPPYNPYYPQSGYYPGYYPPPPQYGYPPPPYYPPPMYNNQPLPYPNNPNQMYGNQMQPNQMYGNQMYGNQGFGLPNNMQYSNNINKSN